MIYLHENESITISRQKLAAIRRLSNFDYQKTKTHFLQDHVPKQTVLQSCMLLIFLFELFLIHHFWAFYSLQYALSFWLIVADWTYSC